MSSMARASLPTLLEPLRLADGIFLPEDSYTTALSCWRRVDHAFDSWQRYGTLLLDDGSLRLDPESAHAEYDPYPRGGYHGGDYYNGGIYLAGEAISPITTTLPFSQAIASWNALTPAGSWIEIQFRARLTTHWSAWYTLGVWASDSETLHRHSVRGQRTDDARISTDTFMLNDPQSSATAFQLKVRFFSTAEALPRLLNTSVAVSNLPRKPMALRSGLSQFWNTSIDVPCYSQMVFPNGGNVWCSPTSLTMVQDYWKPNATPHAARVHATVAGVYDWIYDGHGNWPFNTAYVATLGYEAYAVRFSSLTQAEPLIAQQIPLPVSLAWREGELTGAATPKSNGHLMVLVGFDAEGNPIVNDPAAASDETVRRTYDRREFETLWLQHSGGVAYVIYPAA